VTPFIGVWSSLPTHTPTTRSSVKPMNQASRWSCVVPVLPNTGTSRAAALPVPERTASNSSSMIGGRGQSGRGDAVGRRRKVAPPGARAARTTYGSTRRTSASTAA
jgi:hypothetical protein